MKQIEKSKLSWLGLLTALLGLQGALEVGDVPLPPSVYKWALAIVGALVFFLRVFCTSEGVTLERPKKPPKKRPWTCPGGMALLVLLPLLGCLETPERLEEDLNEIDQDAESAAYAAGLAMIASGETDRLVTIQHQMEDVVQDMFDRTTGAATRHSAEAAGNALTVAVASIGEATEAEGPRAKARLLIAKETGDPVSEEWLSEVLKYLTVIRGGEIAPSIYYRAYAVLRATSAGLKRAREDVYGPE